MKKETKKIERMQRKLDIIPESIDLDNRTIEVVWTTGIRCPQFGSDIGYFTEELEVSKTAINMERLASGYAPLLNMHEGWSLNSILGVVANAWIDEAKKEGRAVVRFAKDDPDIDRIWNLVAQRIICNISVGYEVQEYYKYEENGKIIYRAVKWTPLELSVVTIPADYAANVRAVEKQTLSDCVITYNHDNTYKENFMERTKREDDISDISEKDENEETEKTNRNENDDTEDVDENNDGENENDEENRKSKRFAEKISISRSSFIIDLCTAADLSAREARAFINSDMSISEIRQKILADRQEKYKAINNARAIDTRTSTRSLADFVKEKYKKGE
jgi:hypothetical protein